MPPMSSTRNVSNLPAQEVRSQRVSSSDPNTHQLGSSANSPRARLIAYYLPQYHPIPENDRWWGKGFTEWNNVRAAKPLFPGHYQPHIPAELGYYDLRNSDIRAAQAEMARAAGIEGFCYWHYWFGNGRRLLEKPVEAILASGQPDYPFCLGWANHSWTRKTWSVKGLSDTSMLMEQLYPGKEDHIRHFHTLLPAFEDKRYICVDGKPVMSVFEPFAIPEVERFLALWRKLASDNGLPGIHFVGCARSMSTGLSSLSVRRPVQALSVLLGNSSRSSAPYYQSVLDLGFDAVNSRGMTRAELKVNGVAKKGLLRLLNERFSGVVVDTYEYAEIIKHLFSDEDVWETVYPTLIPNWDRSPRSGKKALVWHNSTPELFGESVDEALELVSAKRDSRKLIFIRSWNEWGEGNHLEPDVEHGMGYLNVLRAKVYSTV